MKEQTQKRTTEARRVSRNFRLPEAHKQAIRDVGFGSFLLLDLDSKKNSFCHELVARFNPDRASLQLPNREEIEVLSEDVHVVFGLPIGGREIKDNKWIEEDEESQIKAFAKFLNEKKVGNGRGVSRFNTTMKEMRWKNNENYNDYGVYALKHMETYMGQLDECWDIGFDPKDPDIMKKLRIEYCGKILTSPANVLQDEVIAKSKTWALEQLRHVNQ
uniref:Uncharacterized protein n=1 Tax=Chenopodium quinoa TaxID=63459 RepID=A0A803N244_CHEQI